MWLVGSFRAKLPGNFSQQQQYVPPTFRGDKLTLRRFFRGRTRRSFHLMTSRCPDLGLEGHTEDADEAKIDRSITRAWHALSDAASHAFTLFA